MHVALKPRHPHCPHCDRVTLGVIRDCTRRNRHVSVHLIPSPQFTNFFILLSAVSGTLIPVPDRKKPGDREGHARNCQPRIENASPTFAILSSS